MRERSLAVQVAVVTGGTSAIGAACVRALVGAGMEVVYAGRREDQLRDLSAELGTDVIGMRMDVRSPTDTDRLVAQAMSIFGRLDPLIASASVGAYGGIMDYSDDTPVTMLGTNVSGTVWSVWVPAPAILTSGTGRNIIVVYAGRPRGGGHEAVHAATKFTQVGLASVLDWELISKGIGVTALLPGQYSHGVRQGARSCFGHARTRHGAPSRRRRAGCERVGEEPALKPDAHIPRYPWRSAPSRARWPDPPG